MDTKHELHQVVVAFDAHVVSTIALRVALFLNGTHNEVEEIKHLSNDIKTVRAGKNKKKILIKMSRILYDPVHTG